MQRLGKDPTDEELHGVRIKAKRARYAAEALGGESKFVSRAKDVQDVLGEHQDAAVAEERIRELVAQVRGTGRTALAAGRLIERQRSRRAAAWRRGRRPGSASAAPATTCGADGARSRWGGVVRRVGPSGVEVLLVHRPRYDDWTFPKGKAQPGETDEETAVREVAEETGITARLGAELPTTQYRDSRGRPKVVRYWTMRPESGSFEPHDEVDEIKWLPIADAAEELSYDRDREVLEALPPPLLVLRHTSAGNSEDWPGDDARRPLDERGRRQAEELVGQLGPYAIERIVSSPFDRCVESVEPIARARGLELETSDDLAEGADLARVRSCSSWTAGHSSACTDRSCGRSSGR